MFVPALFTSTVAISIALGIPERAPPDGPFWIAVVTGDGDILVSRSNGASAMVVARCPALSVEPVAASPDLDTGRDSAGLALDTGATAALGLHDGETAAGVSPGGGVSSLTSEDPSVRADSPPASSLGLDGTDTGQALHRTAPARSACGALQPPAQLAWRQEMLYVACSAGPVYRWREDTGSWPVQLATQGARPDGVLAGASQAVPDRIVAMSGGAEIWLVDESQRLWILAQGKDELRQVGAVPEPVAALATWQGALVAAGATAVWQHSGAGEPSGWEPLVTMAACALSADRDSLWLAGPGGLVELTGQRVRVHALSPLTGIAIRNGDAWLASGRGSLVHAPLTAAGSAMLAGALRLAPESGASGVAAGLLRSVRTRARRARWLPEVVARARWSRSHEGVTPIAPWPDESPGSHAGELALFVWLAWKLDPDDPAIAAAWSAP